MNLKRRHLSESQRAMVANSLANLPVGRNWYNSANLRNNVSQSDAATMLQVSPRSVATAAMVERDAPAEVADAWIERMRGKTRKQPHSETLPAEEKI